MLWLKLTYIKAKSDWVDNYINYLSSKFFPKKETISSYDIEERINIIESALEEYRVTKNEIEKDPKLTNSIKEFLFKRIKESTLKANIAKKAVLFEAEKSWYDILFEWNNFEIKKNKEKIEKIGLTEDFENNKKIYIEEIDSIQTEIYWPKISDIESEKNIVMSICNQKYQENKNKLTNEEQKNFETFLDKFKWNIWLAPKDRKRLPSRGNLSMDKMMEWTEHVKKSFYPNIEWWQTKEAWKTWYSAILSKKTREYPDKEQDLFNKYFLKKLANTQTKNRIFSIRY